MGCFATVRSYRGSAGQIRMARPQHVQRFQLRLQVREIADKVGDSGLTLLINPQWQAGNLVSHIPVAMARLAKVQTPSVQVKQTHLPYKVSAASATGIRLWRRALAKAVRGFGSIL